MLEQVKELAVLHGLPADATDNDLLKFLAERIPERQTPNEQRAERSSGSGMLTRPFQDPDIEAEEAYSRTRRRGQR